MFLAPKDSTAIVWQDEHISYTTLLNRVHAVSAILAPKAPTKIAIFSENRAEWAYALYAGWETNATVVPIDFLASVEDVSYILNDCKPEIVFTSEKSSGVLFEALPNLESKPEILIFENLDYSNDGDAKPTSIDGKSDKTAVIIYTSGTTGNPKGVMLSFDNISANIEAVSENIPIYTEARNVMVLLPLHHVFPLVGSLIAPLMVGATAAFTPSIKSSDIIATLKENKIGIIIGVPRLYDAILKGIMSKINANPIAKNLFRLAKRVNSQSFSRKIFKKVHDTLGGKVDYLVSGGAKLEPELARNYKALGFEMLEGFGMSEAAPMITFTRPGRWVIGSAGERMPGMEVISKDGEIIARGRNIMQGYFNRPEETAAIIKDGWLHTGDLGYFDKKGFIHVTGRSKDIIVLSNGKNINPEEIEFKLLAMSPFILEVAVFAKSDTLNCIIYPDFAKMKESGIQNFEEALKTKVIEEYNNSASSYKRLGKFYISRDELPKTRLGKIQRFKLESLLLPSKDKFSKAEPQFEEYIVIRDFLKGNNRGVVSPDDHFDFDLALDSLEKINFQVFLESTFGIKLEENIFQTNPTVEKLAAFMREKKNKLQVETVRWSEILREKIDLYTLPRSRFTHNWFKNISKVFFKLYFRVESSGIENLPQEPFIIAPNHQSFFDGLFILMFLKKKVLKNTYFYAKSKHVKPGLVKKLADNNNVIVMDINKDLKLSMQKLAAALRMKKNIIIFPEGTRSTTGSLGDFKKFFAVLSLECSAPVVPVSIVGADKALPKGSILPRPWKKITIKFHKAVYPEGHSYESMKDTVVNRLAQEFTGLHLPK